MEDISHIIARKLLKVATKEEENKLSEWEDLSPRNRAFFDGLKNYWNYGVQKKAGTRLELARQRLQARIRNVKEKKSERSWSTYLLRIAAVFTLIISFSGLSVYLVSQSGLFYQKNRMEISTEAGQRSKVVLPDGSRVWLNAETALTYCSDKKERKVLLSGEAYFEVAHSQSYPFVVETGDTKIKVLGTKFDVSHYPDSKLTTASLLAGRIAMTLKSDQTIELKPGEKLVYNADENVFSKEITKVKDETLWKQGILVFNNEPFQVLIQHLERFYAVKIDYNPVEFDEIHYTGTIDNLSIDNVLEFINLTIPINYEVNNKTIKLSLKSE